MRRGANTFLTGITLRQYRDLLFELFTTSGKPSTRLPLGELVEQVWIIKREYSRNRELRNHDHATNSGGSIAPRQVYGQTRRMVNIKAHDHKNVWSSRGLIPTEESGAERDKGCRAHT